LKSTRQREKRKGGTEGRVKIPREEGMGEFIAPGPRNNKGRTINSHPSPTVRTGRTLRSEKENKKGTVKPDQRSLSEYRINIKEKKKKEAYLKDANVQEKNTYQKRGTAPDGR